MKGITNLQILNHREGRFGNQLFRIATLIGQSLDKNIDYFIPKEWEHCELFPNLKNTFLSEDIKKNINKKHQESKFGYHDIETSDKITEIIGYFQSHSFFSNHELTVKHDLELNPELVNEVKKKLNPKTVKVCIHIRWGDPYDRNVGGGHKGVENRHPVMTLSYYEKSLEYILNNRKIDELLIFTDNVDSKDFINEKFDKFEIPIVYFDYSDDYVSDFIAQSLCDHFIIANSTFSWWSSYLSSKPNKIICCPQPHEWFGPEYRHFDTSTLLPKDWININQ